MLPHTIFGLIVFGIAAGGVGYVVIGGLHRAIDWLDERSSGR